MPTCPRHKVELEQNLFLENVLQCPESICDFGTTKQSVEAVQQASGPRLKIELPIPRSVNDIYEGMGKNRRIAAAYEKWQYLANLAIAEQGPHVSFSGRVEITLTVQGGKGFSDSQDMDNLWKGVLDRIVNRGIIVDDCARYVPKGHWEYIEPTDPKQAARCWIEITEIGERR